MELIQDILTELFITGLFAAVLLISNRRKLAEFFGFRSTHIDIPVDPSTGKVMLVKTVPNRKGQVAVWVFPQCRARDNWRDSAERNAEELGLRANLYKAKKFISFVGATRATKKSYQLAMVKVSESRLSRIWELKQISSGIVLDIPDSVEYDYAQFVSPPAAMQILEKEAEKGETFNAKRLQAYKKALKELFPNQF